MRGPRVKYAGMIVAIIGFFVLIVLGGVYVAYDVWRTTWEVSVTDYAIPAIIGAVLLVAGILTYVFVEE